MGAELKIDSETRIPLKWFAVLLVCWIVTTVYGSVKDNNHLERMDAFMSAGGRFTGEQGKVHEDRITKSELQIEALKQEIKELKNAR